MHNEIGVHSLVWTGQTDPASLREAIVRSAECGYSIVELSLHDVSALDPAAVDEAAREAGVSLVCSCGLPFEADISSTDTATVKRGHKMLEQMFQRAHEMGARLFCGALYAALGKHAHPVSATGRANAVTALRELAEVAREHDLALALEVINRYENPLINCACDGLRLLDDIGADEIGLHLDTYHMNIEEADLVQPVLDCGERLHYVHVGDNHRGYMGAGHIDFPAFFHALARVGYDRPVTFESFSSAVVAEPLSSDLAIWRDLWSDSQDLAAHAQAFIATHLRAAGQTPG